MLVVAWNTANLSGLFSIWGYAVEEDSKKVTITRQLGWRMTQPRYHKVSVTEAKSWHMCFTAHKWDFNKGLKTTRENRNKINNVTKRLWRNNIYCLTFCHLVLLKNPNSYQPEHCTSGKTDGSLITSIPLKKGNASNLVNLSLCG